MGRRAAGTSYRTGVMGRRAAGTSYRTGVMGRSAAGTSYRTGIMGRRAAGTSYRTGVMGRRAAGTSYRTGIIEWRAASTSYRTGVMGRRAAGTSYRTGVMDWRAAGTSYRTGVMGRRAAGSSYRTGVMGRRAAGTSYRTGIIEWRAASTSYRTGVMGRSSAGSSYRTGVMGRRAAVLVLMLVIITSSAEKSDGETACEKLQKEWQIRGDNRGDFRKSGEVMPYLEQSLDVRLLWRDRLSRAAAALLRATLLAAGYRPAQLQLQNYSSERRLLARDQILEVEVRADKRLQVQLTAQAARRAACRDLARCLERGLERGLVWGRARSLERSSARGLEWGLARGLQWSLKRALEWGLERGSEALRECDFMAPGRNKPTLEIYNLEKCHNTASPKEFIRHSIANWSTVQLLHVDLLNLTHLIRKANYSFIFLDAVQENVTKEVAKPPPAANDTSFTSIYNTVLLNYADGLLPETFVKFSPSLTDLFSVLDIFDAGNQGNVEEAACTWALEGNEGFNNWRASALEKPPRGIVLVILCASKTFNMDLQEMTHMVKGYTLTPFLTFIDRDTIQLKVMYFDCNESNWLIQSALTLYETNVIAKSEGVIMSENVAAILEQFAAHLSVPILTYDVASGAAEARTVRAATGCVYSLQRAMQRLLAGCGWQRVAVISEPTRLSEALSATLRAPAAQLTLRETIIKSQTDIEPTLRELLDADARVILVNTGASSAAAILAAAQKLNITRDRGFSWIVREYDVADNATAVTRPISVSFWWRGDRDNTTNERDERKRTGTTEEVTLRKKLEEKWRGRAWPLHAAPLLDALFTMREGIRRYKYDTWPRKKKLDSFWKNLQDPIRGIHQNLTYDEYGVSEPLVYVEQWGSEPRPRLLATWRGSARAVGFAACPVRDPPHDGSATCFLSSGDPFQPKCRDVIWISSTVLAIFVGLALIAAVIHWSRKALVARDLHIKTEYAKRLLARRERVFEALAEHLVERSALDLHQELGTGRFGRVHLGVLRNARAQRNQNTVIVAAKALREESSAADESEFLKEACTLSRLDHEHIIRFLGICIVDGPPLLLMEYAFFGDLLHYLQARRCLAGEPMHTSTVCNYFGLNEKTHVSAASLTKLAQEAAAALAYLARRGVVHRDLRASNCLVDERRRLKLADFGLARATGTIDGEYACRRGLFPVLWMAPESLATGISSAASDVWSFGVLVFELVTLGRRPYGTRPPAAVLRHVVAGGQPQLPWDASAETLALTRACWRREPGARPAAARLAGWLAAHARALRPALVPELLDLDSPVYANKDCSDLDIGLSEPLTSEVLTS